MEGIRILEVAEHTFVPAASAILADWGAEVIKIEHVERGDAMRGLGSSGSPASAARRARAARALEPRQEEPRARPRRPDGPRHPLPARGASATSSSPTRWRASASGCRSTSTTSAAHNPNIVYVRGTGYGNDGPRRRRGRLRLPRLLGPRAASATRCTPADLDGDHRQPGPAFGDSIGAMTIAGGIAAALLHRERTGEPHVVDVSLLGTGMWAMGGTIALSPSIGMPMEAGRAAPASGGAGQPAHRPVPHRRRPLHRALDAAGLPLLARVLHPPRARPSSSPTPASTPTSTCMENTPAAQQIVPRSSGPRTLDECRERVRRHARPVGDRCRTRSRSRDDPQVARQRLPPGGGDVGRLEYKLVATPVQFDEARVAARGAPDFNEHGDEILTERARPRLGRHHRPQGEGRRRLTLPLLQPLWRCRSPLCAPCNAESGVKVRGPSGGCR